jgi:HEPN domain-containing protein
MNEMASRWLTFAQEDLRMAKLALEQGIYNQVCFHAQQCAEKALKALIANKGEAPPKTHKLIDLLPQIDHPPITRKRKDLRSLDRFYIPTRYPDALPGALPEGLPNEADAQEALAKAQQVLDTCKALLTSAEGTP